MGGEDVPAKEVQSLEVVEAANGSSVSGVPLATEDYHRSGTRVWETSSQN
jgi:hypothetical protein